jgi:hypothetical protein
MREAIRNISARGRRDDLVVAMLTYAHQAWLTEHYFTKGLKAANLEILDKGPLSESELKRVLAVGRYIYGK